MKLTAFLFVCLRQVFPKQWAGKNAWVAGGNKYCIGCQLPKYLTFFFSRNCIKNNIESKINTMFK